MRGLVILLFYVSFLSACTNDTIPEKYSNWTVYTTSNSDLPADDLGMISIDASQNIWISGYMVNGLIKFNGSSFESIPTFSYNSGTYPFGSVRFSCIGNTLWMPYSMAPYLYSLLKYTNGQGTIYDSSNFGWPTVIREVDGNQNDNLWLGTSRGLVNFDGVNWVLYNTSNSGLPSNDIFSVHVDQNNVVWGCAIQNMFVPGDSSGVFRFDGISWTHYNTVNSGLPTKGVFSVSSEPSGKVWLSNGLNVTSFDLATWNNYLLHDSQAPSDYVYISSICVERDSLIWVGTDHGLFRFDGIHWEQFTTSNSGLPSNMVYYIAIDKFKNKWMTTDRGLAVYAN